MLKVILAALAVGEAPRYWPHFSGSRAVSTLDSDAWKYAMNMDPHFDSMDPFFSPSNATLTTTAAVPSCSDVVHGGAAGYLGPRGVAMYERPFTTSGPIRLQFQACSFYCRVWINGKEIGEHRNGGYSAFFFDVDTDVLASNGENTLFVLADNRFNATTAPTHTGGDFWHYGGLVRSVEVHSLPTKTGDIYPWRAWVLPSKTTISDETFTAPTAVDITVSVMGADATPGSNVTLTLSFDGGTSSTVSAKVLANRTIYLAGIPVPTPMLWAPRSPLMHTVAVAIDGAVVTERFGLRAFALAHDATDGSTRITLNGEVLKMVGWNHHTQWPVTAASPTDAQLDADIALLLEGGANYVRGAHYPQDPRWLDRLDEVSVPYYYFYHFL